MWSTPMISVVKYKKPFPMEKKASVPMFFVVNSKKQRLEKGLGFRAWTLRL